jgi:RimJ/RimL family protein N-acetyltransferase
MILVIDDRFGPWVAQRLKNVRDFRDYKAIGVTDGREVLAAVVYHDYRPAYKSIEISMAANNPRWALRSVISALLSYPFVQLQCERITLTIPKKNRRARRFVKGIGFVEEGCARKGFGRDDAMIYGMLRREAMRWLEEKHGKKFTERACSA